VRRDEHVGTFDDPDQAAKALDAQSSSESRLDPMGERHRRRAFDLLAMCAVGLVPWTVLLATTLPKEYHVHHWQLTWVGFDVLLIAAMGTTAILGWRRRISVVVSALLTATLLVCDAWFDVGLDIGTGDVWLAVALAVFVELPVAGFLIHRVHALISSLSPAQPRALRVPTARSGSPGKKFVNPQILIQRAQREEPAACVDPRG
jgi:hypothetical protein